MSFLLVCNRAYPIELFQVLETTDDDGNEYIFQEEIDYLISTPELIGTQELRFGFSAEQNGNDWRTVGLSFNGEILVTFTKGNTGPDCKLE